MSVRDRRAWVPHGYYQERFGVPEQEARRHESADTLLKGLESGYEAPESISAVLDRFVRNTIPCYDLRADPNGRSNTIQDHVARYLGKHEQEFETP